MSDGWIDLGAVEDLVPGRAWLKKAGALRVACVRDNNCVHVVDDRCPHQGYPLSQGRVAGGELVCEWHNWRFDLATGECRFGGEGVRRYPSRIDNGRLLVDARIDVAEETARTERSLREALKKDDASRALRDALRLGELRGTSCSLGRLAPALEALARDGAARCEYGFDHPLALTADACAQVARGWLPAEEAFVLCATAVGEASVHLAARASPSCEPEALLDATLVTMALCHERRDEAEARVRALVRARGAETAVREALLPFACRHIYDYGHGTIFLLKALELAQRFPGAAEELLAAATVQLGWATADTALPPFAATRRALEALDAVEPAPAAGALDRARYEPAATAAPLDRARYEAAVLAGERAAIDATGEALARHCDPLELLRATAHAAAVRVARFDAAWEQRLDAEVGVLDVTHAVTFCEAALSLLAGAACPPALGRRTALLAAAFVGKLRAADARAPTPFGTARGSLLDAARSRDAARARAVGAALDPGARLDAYRELGPFLAFEAAVRPIFYAHTVKMGEALWRLQQTDPDADGAYLDALLAFAVPRRAERRFCRAAAVASKFVADGRPPETLY